MFRLIDDTAPERVEIVLDGETLEVPAGIPLAAALLLVDRIPTRFNAMSNSARAPFCMMGACFDCVMDIDGVSGQRACQVEVRDGMQVRRHRGVNADTGEAT